MNNYIFNVRFARPVLAAEVNQSRKVETLTASQRAMQDEMLRAAAAGDTPTVARLIGECPAIMAGRDARDLSALHLAAANGHPDTIRKLLELGMDLQESDDAGPDYREPLHYAAENGQTQTVSALLEMGAETDARDSMGISPLDLACENGHLAIVKRLLQERIDIVDCDVFGVHSINFAARNQAPEMIEALLAANANPNVVSDNDWTPIHQAALRGHDQTIRALVAGGADPNGKKVKTAYALGKRTIRRLSPISLAITGDHFNAVFALIESGADLTTPTRFKKTIRERLKKTIRGIINNAEPGQSLVSMIKSDSPAVAGFSGICAVLHNASTEDVQAIADKTAIRAVRSLHLIDGQQFRNYFGKFHHEHPLFKRAMTPLCYSVLTERCDIIGALMKSKQYQHAEIDHLRELAESYSLFQSVAAIDYYSCFLPPEKLQVLSGRTIRSAIVKNREKTELSTSISKLPLPPLLLEYIKVQCHIPTIRQVAARNKKSTPIFSS